MVDHHIIADMHFATPFIIVEKGPPRIYITLSTKHLPSDTAIHIVKKGPPPYYNITIYHPMLAIIYLLWLNDNVGNVLFALSNFENCQRLAKGAPPYILCVCGKKT